MEKVSTLRMDTEITKKTINVFDIMYIYTGDA